MRLRLSYEILGERAISLPVHYNYHLQGLIYRTFSDELSNKLHQEGFAFEKRKFKLFTFSRILEKGDLKKSSHPILVFGRKISFYFSSLRDDIVENLVKMFFKKSEFVLCGQRIRLSQLEIITPPKFENQMLVKTLSPITVYSTFTKEDGKKIIHYYKPYEEGFQILIEENARKKYRLVYENDPSKLNLSIKPYRFSTEKNHVVIFFKNNPVEGWTGVYELSGSIDLMSITYNAGLGSKNSEGFGMWEVWKGSERDA